MAWACANQLGRRNLDNNQRAMLIKEMYENQRKLKSGAPMGNVNASKQWDKNYPIVLEDEAPKRTTAKMAEYIVYSTLSGRRKGEITSLII